MEQNKFLSELVQKISLECYKGLMKQGKIEHVRQRQVLCQEGEGISHIVVLLDGKLGVVKQEDDFIIPKNSEKDKGKQK